MIRYRCNSHIRLPSSLVVVVSAEALKRIPPFGYRLVRARGPEFEVEILSPPVHTLVKPGLAIAPGEEFGLVSGSLSPAIRSCLDLIHGKEPEKLKTFGEIPEVVRWRPQSEPEIAKEELGIVDEPVVIDRAALIREAVDGLGDEDRTSQGLPKVESVALLTGLDDVTRLEITEAMEASQGD